MMPGDWQCTSCAAWGRYNNLHFACDSCAGEVCPNCAGMGPSDVDDPMPKVAECPACHNGDWEAA